MNLGTWRRWGQASPYDSVGMEEERNEAMLLLGGGILVVASYLMTSVSEPARPATWVVPVDRLAKKMGQQGIL